MVSVIVPIYNVEAYLRQCVDSILAQTYTDLEVILVNDGSTDRSGEIACSYEDSRIRVFQTTNRGLSAARNFGIDHANGDYLIFIDSDDWINSDLIEKAVLQIGNADIVCFGANGHSFGSASYSGHEALIALIHERLPKTVWGKLYRKECFVQTRFPEGRAAEDIYTVYQLYLKSSRVISIDDCGYHYRYRTDSLSHSLTMKSLIDYWDAQKERYNNCRGLVDESTRILLLRFCAVAIIRAWAWKNSFTKNIPPVFPEMSSFVKNNYRYSVLHRYPFRIKIGLLFAGYPHRISFWTANKLFLTIRHFPGVHWK